MSPASFSTAYSISIFHLILYLKQLLEYFRNMASQFHNLTYFLNGFPDNISTRQFHARELWNRLSHSIFTLNLQHLRETRILSFLLNRKGNCNRLVTLSTWCNRHLTSSFCNFTNFCYTLFRKYNLGDISHCASFTTLC